MKRLKTRMSVFFLIVCLFAMMLSVQATSTVDVGVAAALEDDSLDTLTIAVNGTPTAFVTYYLTFKNADYDDAAMGQVDETTNTERVYKHVIDKNDSGNKSFSVNLESMGLLPGQSATLRFEIAPKVSGTRVSVGSTNVPNKPAVSGQVYAGTGVIENAITIVSNNGRDAYTYTVSLAPPPEPNPPPPPEPNPTPTPAVTDEVETFTLVDDEIARAAPLVPVRIMANPIGDGFGIINGVAYVNEEVGDEYAVDFGWYYPLVAKPNTGSVFMGWYEKDAKEPFSMANEIGVYLTNEDMEYFARFDPLVDNKGTVEIVDNKDVPKGPPSALPQTGGLPLLLVSSLGLGFLSMGFLFRRKRRHDDLD